MWSGSQVDTASPIACARRRPGRQRSCCLVAAGACDMKACMGTLRPRQPRAEYVGWERAARVGVVQDVRQDLRLLEILELVGVAVLVERVDVCAGHANEVGQQLGGVLGVLLLLHEHVWRPPRAHGTGQRPLRPPPGPPRTAALAGAAPTPPTGTPSTAASAAHQQHRAIPSRQALHACRDPLTPCTRTRPGLVHKLPANFARVQPAQSPGAALVIRDAYWSNTGFSCVPSGAIGMTLGMPAYAGVSASASSAATATALQRQHASQAPRAPAPRALPQAPVSTMQHL